MDHPTSTARQWASTTKVPITRLPVSSIPSGGMLRCYGKRHEIHHGKGDELIKIHFTTSTDTTQWVPERKFKIRMDSHFVCNFSDVTCTDVRTKSSCSFVLVGEREWVLTFSAVTVHQCAVCFVVVRSIFFPIFTAFVLLLLSNFSVFCLDTTASGRTHVRHGSEEPTETSA